MISKSHHYLKFQYLWIASCQWEIYAHFWRFNEAGDSHYVKKNVIIYSDNFSFGTFYAKLSSQQRSFRFNWRGKYQKQQYACCIGFSVYFTGCFQFIWQLWKYLYGYGKYELLRYKKRTLILGKIILKSFLSVCVFCLTRIIIYAFYYLSATKKLLILQLQIFQIIFSQAFYHCSLSVYCNIGWTEVFIICRRNYSFFILHSFHNSGWILYWKGAIFSVTVFNYKLFNEKPDKFNISWFCRFIHFIFNFGFCNYCMYFFMQENHKTKDIF